MKRNRLAKNDGVTMVILAVVMLVLLSVAALALDIGRMYIAKQRAQNVADASALAGAMFLTGTTTCEPAVQNAADGCASANNATDTGTHWTAHNPDTHEQGVSVSFPTTITTATEETIEVNEGEAVLVVAEVPVEFSFAKIMNHLNATVEASAVVILADATNPKAPFMPLSLATSQVWDSSGNPVIGPGDIQSLKVTSWQDKPVGPGDFGAISFEGDSGGQIYRDRLAGDPDVPPVSLYEGMTVDTLPGNKIGPTDQGILDRLQGDNYTYDSWKATYDPETGTFADTTRAVLIPIIEVGDGISGQKTVEVVGFAAFFIESYDKKTGYIEGYFMQAMSVGDTIKWNPFGNFEPGTTSLLKTPKLVG